MKTRTTKTLDRPKAKRNGRKLTCWLPQHLYKYLQDTAQLKTKGNITSVLISVLTNARNKDIKSDEIKSITMIVTDFIDNNRE